MRVLVLFAIGCGASPATATKADPSIVVLERGEEPRRRLRFETKPFGHERMEMVFKLRSTATMTNTVLETGTQTTDLPTTVFTSRVEVMNILPTGEVEPRSEIEEVSVLDDLVDPSLRATAEARAGAMKGVRVSWRRSPSGVVSEVTFDTSKARNASMVRDRIESYGDSLASAAVVFPDVEIGSGATWQVSSRIKSSGVVWDRKATYKLRSVEGSTALVDAEIDLRASSQELSVEPKSTTRLNSATSHQSVELEIPLQGLVPKMTGLEMSDLDLTFVRGRARLTSTVKFEAFTATKRLP